MRLVYISVLAILLFSCQKNPDLTGTYRLQSRQMEQDGNDIPSNGVHVKIHSGNYVIDAHYQDSSAWFGVAQVRVANGDITERNIYKARGESENVSAEFVHYRAEETETTWRQVIMGVETSNGEGVPISEVYARADTGRSSPVDGAWRLSRAFTVKGTDTTKLQIVQYKFYQSGYFIFGHSIRSAAFEPASTGIGYGTFQMTGDDSLVENVEVSSYQTIVGKSFNIRVSMPSTNELVQVVDELDGVKSVEFYERLVKGEKGGVETW